MFCETHPDREGRLAVDLPSIGVKRYLCEECRSNLFSRILMIPSEVDRWVYELSQCNEDRRVDMLDAYHTEGLKWRGK